LFKGEEPGRIDAAICEARGALRRDNGGQLRSTITPILHLQSGYHRLFDFEALTPIKPAVSTLSVAAPAVVISRLPLPAALQDALRARRCIPVIGPGILRAGISRSSAAPPGPLELVRLFTKEPRRYPRQSDLDWCTSNPGNEWLHSLVLQWVCQHHAQDENGWVGLAADICAQYEKLQPPELLRRFAELKLPAMFYTWFDGLLHGCVAQGRSDLNQVITSLTPPATVLREGERRPLVLLRGSVHDPQSLVITEDDHERLADNIARMPAELHALTHKFAHSVLFIGLSPREPLVHQLCQKLLASKVAGRRKQGPTFFLCADNCIADEAYWAQFDTKWIIDELDPFLMQVLEAAS
jgi:hypothetical protein